MERPQLKDFRTELGPGIPGYVKALESYATLKEQQVAELQKQMVDDYNLQKQIDLEHDTLVASLESKLAQAKEALEKYGAHQGNCLFSNDEMCDCGLNQAISQAEGKP